MDSRPFVVLMNAARIQRSLRRMAYSIAETYYYSNHLYVVGIHEVGSQIAQLLLDQIKPLIPCPCHFGSMSNMGESDTTHLDYISDLKQMQDMTILLVDDVVFTGKTLQKAAQQILSVCEPQQLACVALVDRGHRHFPIELNVVGLHWPTKLNEYVQVSWSGISASNQVLLYYD